MSRLPIDEVLPRLAEALPAGGGALLTAPPGAGKTTRVPLALLSTIPPGQRIVMLEPRRLAAVSAARWMAGILGEEAGGTIGYTIRFASRVSPATRVEVVTEGIMTRRLQSDPGLAGVGLVILDEFHERSLEADLALALLLDARRHLRHDLRLLVMSATLEVEPVAALLGDAPVISSTGRAFPVEVRWLEHLPGRHLPERMARAVERALDESEGDLLAFLPGAGEIRSCAELLASSPAVAGRGIDVRPLYGDLPFAEQERAILPGPRRRVVLATSIAETSLTIEGVRTVIDCGMTRRLHHDPASGLDRLVTVRASQASACQRAGRAGRLGPGVCYRLYGRHAFAGMVPFSPPEMRTADLSSLLLELSLWGGRDFSSLAWLDPPPAGAMAAARDLLRELGALDGAGATTPTGRAMARLPLHPRLARMLLRAADLGIPDLGGDLAALLSERDIFRPTTRQAASHSGDSDLDDRLEALAAWRKGRNPPPGADPGALRTVERAADQLRRLIGGRRAATPPPSIEAVARLLLTAYPDRLARRRVAGSDRYLLANGRGASLSPKSCLRDRQFVAAVNVDAGRQGEGVIRLAVAVSPEIIREELGGRIERRRAVGWNPREERVTAAEEERLGAVLLASRPTAPSPEEAVPLLCRFIRERGLAAVDASGARRQLQGRVRFVAGVFPGEGWPDLADEALLARLEDWLAPFLGERRSAADLAALDTPAALRALLSRERLRRLDALAPTHLPVPSGHRISLDYEGGEAPVLAVKLQELFGLAESPTVAGGRVPVLLHLLSPAGRPIQVTRDLRGFWDGAYREVRKELRGRYPRHPWPEDPWSAVPSRRTKPRGR